MKDAIQAIRKQTDAPFAVSIFSNVGPDNFENFDAVNKELNIILESLGILSPDKQEMWTPDRFDEQFHVLLEEKILIISTTFGLLSDYQVQQAKSLGVKIINEVTTVMRRSRPKSPGCDVIVAQGSEAGGHRDI
ncbi:nitronate monooxygenase [Paenibacillus taichungensis]